MYVYIYRINFVPIVVFCREIQTHYVSTHGCHFKLAVAKIQKLAKPFVNAACAVKALVAVQLAVGKYFGDALSQRRLLCNHEYKHSTFSLHSYFNLIFFLLFQFFSCVFFFVTFSIRIQFCIHFAYLCYIANFCIHKEVT